MAGSDVSSVNALAHGLYSYIQLFVSLGMSASSLSLLLLFAHIRVTSNILIYILPLRIGDLTRRCRPMPTRKTKNEEAMCTCRRHRTHITMINRQTSRKVACTSWAFVFEFFSLFLSHSFSQTLAVSTSVQACETDHMGRRRWQVMPQSDTARVCLWYE